MKAFNAFSCSGNSLVTSKTRQVFSMLASTFSAILDFYLLTQSHSSHSSLLRKCNIRSDWMKFTKGDDVMNTAFNEVYQTGKGVSAWQKPRTTWTVWESGYLGGPQQIKYPRFMKIIASCHPQNLTITLTMDNKIFFLYSFSAIHTVN